MLRRGPGARFMPNSMVFPGGVFDPELDPNFPREKTNFDPGARQPIHLGLGGDFALRVCALRELFEESGLLPVEDQNCREHSVLSADEDPHLAEWRKKVGN